MISHLPSDYACSPGQPCSEASQYNQASPFQTARPIQFIQQKRNAGGRCISVLTEIHGKLFHRLIQSSGNCFHNPPVRLMKKKAADLILFNPVLLQNLPDHLRYFFDCKLENCLTIHLHEIFIRCHPFRYQLFCDPIAVMSAFQRQSTSLLTV